jgi:hypothetical protein
MLDRSSSNASPTRPPIFLIGLPRSGSTLWANVMHQHSEVVVFPEMHFLNPWNWDFRVLIRRAGDLSVDQNVQRLIVAMFSEPPPKGIRRSPYFWRQMRRMAANGMAEAILHRILAAKQRDIGCVFRSIIVEATLHRSKSQAVVQFPVYPAYVDRLSHWWPEAYLLHISRDPRSLAASKTNDPGGTGNLIKRFPRFQPILRFAGMSFATLQYIWASRAHARMVGQRNYKTFFYEQLVTEPERTVRNICDFCGLDFQVAMLTPGPGQASSLTGQKVGGFDTTRAHGWQQTLSPRQSYLIGRITASSMRRFGYVPEID